MRKLFLLFLMILSVSMSLNAQKVKIFGTITDQKGQKLPGITVRADSTNIFTNTDPQGYFELKLLANTSYKIILTSLYYQDDTLSIITSNQGKEYNFILKDGDISLNPIYAIAFFVDETGMERISSKNLSVLPDISGNGVETLIKTGMGVSSNNELSAQYNVRGGNFDENLIYVNDIQIYRPFLVRSGQQEGLSFINSDLVNSIKFSAGGFDAKYDDKMSSVLDITYKEPSDFEASTTISLLSTKAHIEAISKNKKFTTIAGFRYKRSSYLFNTFEVQGDYKPIFADFQSFSTYKINDKFSVSLLTNVTSNEYNFIPTQSSSDFGTFSQRMSVDIYYEGQEKDSYQTVFGAFTFNYQPTSNWNFKLLTSAYQTNESEKFDILAQYYLNQVEDQQDSVSNGDSVLNLGVGSYQTHARNYLNALISNVSFKTKWSTDYHLLQFGTKFQLEQIDDILSEWKYVDSAGYSTSPFHIVDDNYIHIYNTIKAKNSLSTTRISSYIQDSYNFNIGFTKVKSTFGIRGAYNNYTNEILISPRFSVLISPDWQKKWFFRLSSGIYYQPPFYREMRRFDGTLVTDAKSQRSIQLVLGAYNTLKIWNRPFKFSTELYYKKLDNIIPYELDNLRIKYYADDLAVGYAAGIDFKLYGEFVPGTDSWISVSFLNTMEDIIDDSYTLYLDDTGAVTNNQYLVVDTLVMYPGYIPRPSDQRVNIGVFFQDYVPGNEHIKVNLAYFFGTSVPFGPPQAGRYRATLRSAFPYIRGDVGFSFLLKSPQRIYPKGHILSPFKSIWAKIEVFNFMGIKNIAAYNWLELVPNTANPYPISYDMIAAPNRLTGRLVNIKFSFRF